MPELVLMTSNPKVFFPPLMTHLCNRYDRCHLKGETSEMDHRKHKVTIQPLLPLLGCQIMMHQVGRQSWLLFTLFKLQNMLMKMKLPDPKRHKNDLPDASQLDVVFPHNHKSPLCSSSLEGLMSSFLSRLCLRQYCWDQSIQVIQLLISNSKNTVIDYCHLTTLLHK